MPILKNSSLRARGSRPARRRLLVVLFTAVASLGLPRTAAADPVTAVFDVSVFQRFDLARQFTEHFASNFQLTLQFDGGSTLFVSPDLAVRQYGPPTFSPVPSSLVVASRPEGMETVVRPQVTDRWFRSDDVYHRTSIAALLETDLNFSSEYVSGIILTQPSVGGGLPAPPELTTESFLQHLGTGNTINFLYSGFAATGSGADRRFAPNSYQYQGIARLVRYDIPGGEQPPASPNPVPEPATMLLLGSGLAGLALRRTRSRRGLPTERPDDGCPAPR